MADYTPEAAARIPITGPVDPNPNRRPGAGEVADHGHTETLRDPPPGGTTRAWTRLLVQRVIEGGKLGKVSQIAVAHAGGQS